LDQCKAAVDAGMGANAPYLAWSQNKLCYGMYSEPVSQQAMQPYTITTMCIRMESRKTGSISRLHGFISSLSGIEASVNVTSFPEYGDYSGNFSVSGMVEVSSGPDGVELEYMLSLGTPCALNSSKANSCGIHIHDCVTCDNLGGHYYNSSAMADPWTTINYAPNGTGQTNFISIGYDGFPSKQCVVLHDSEGVKATCTEIPLPSCDVIAVCGNRPEIDDCQGISDYLECMMDEKVCKTTGEAIDIERTVLSEINETCWNPSTTSSSPHNGNDDGDNEDNSSTTGIIIASLCAVIIALVVGCVIFMYYNYKETSTGNSYEPLDVNSVGAYQPPSSIING